MKKKNITIAEHLKDDLLKPEYVELNISDINLSESIMRTFIQDESFEDLIKSIQTVGLINAITVHKKNGQYYLIAGLRRTMAFRRLNKKTIQARIIHGDISHVMKVQYIENVHRENVSLLDESKYLESCKTKLMVSNEELAKMLGKSESYITKRIAFVKMNPDVIKAVLNKRITLNMAMYVNKLKNDADVTYMIYFLESNKLNDQELKEYVDQILEQNELSKLNNTVQDSKAIVDSTDYDYPKGKCDVCGNYHYLTEIKVMHICEGCINEEVPE